VVVSPAELGTKNDCAGEDYQQFTLPDPNESVSRYIVSSLYLATISEQTENCVL
jgi:hypothetical protein